jgi:amino acid adenylation domain-containing protein
MMGNMTSSRTLSEFLDHLRRLDIRLALEGERLSCNAPKGALDAALRSELQERKPAIIEWLRGGTAAVESSPPPIRSRPRTGEEPIAFAQQRLWFLDRMDPGNPAYHIVGGLHLTGALDRDALNRSGREVVRRHEVLRTAFVETGGAVHGVLRDADGWRLETIDLTGVTPAERAAAIADAAGCVGRRSFDLTQGPFLRAALLELTPVEHRLVIVLHRIAADGWSLGALVRELLQLYGAFREGQPAPLPPPLQYHDYVAWHREWLESGLLEAELPFWQRALAGPLPLLELPPDRPRPPVLAPVGRRLAFSISEELTEQLKQLGRREEVSLFVTLLAGFEILLSRYTGQDDVIVGTTATNRTRAEWADLIGLVANDLAVRTDLSGNPTVREVLDRVRRVVLDGLAHREVPFDRLVEVLKPERSLNRTPLFQTQFVLQDWEVADIALPDLRVELTEVDLGIARFDLSVEAMEQNGRLQFAFEFNRELFDPSSIERLERHYEQVLASMVTDLDQRLDELPLITPAERDQLVVQWNRTAAPFLECGVHELIEAEAARTPEREAMRAGAVSLTYGQLVERANRLAHHLIRLGVGPETLVGVALDRSADLVVALLAVWKAGGAYVPMDPSYPSERLAFMMTDAGLGALITETAVLEHLPAPPCPVVVLDRDGAAIAAESAVAPLGSPDPHRAAYVIYTSGSTGKPKGVVVEHRSVVNFLTAMREQPGMTSADTLLSVTTLSFDIAGLELYLPLVSGARVVVVSRATAGDGLELAKAMRETGTTIMQATPATWRLLFESGWRDGTGLKLLCGGEALPRALADQLLATGAEVWNLYGPTETTIWSTIHRVEPGQGPVPIGRPIANTTAYILDGRRQLVPVGVPGELYLGGAGLARGYHGRPELTGERFVPDPFESKPNARLYRTGDRARYRPDGTIEYLGRSDHQVKLRGFRIELGEIEAALAVHEEIRQAVVELREEVAGDQRLVAYFVPKTPPGPTVATLRDWLSGRLPAFMVPSAFVSLAALPLTPNGKIDRRALPASGRGVEPAIGFASPRSGVEEAVAGIWRDVLRIDRVGIHDNFFDLGGHSLLVVQLQSRLRERFEREFTLMELFRRPTVSAIAESLSQFKPGASALPNRESSPAAPNLALAGD